MSIRRGLLGAVLGAVGGGAAPPAVLYGGTALRWLATGADGFDRRYDLDWLADRMPGPVIACAVVCAGAGWATLAPAGRFRFARSLGSVAGVSLVLWCLTGWADQAVGLSPRRMKGADQPRFYPSEWVMLVVPPVLAAAILTRMRIGKATPQPRPSPEDFPLE